MTLLFTGATEIVTCSGNSARVHTGAALTVSDGRVMEVGEADALRMKHPDATLIDCAGCTITPGFVDSHTHTAFGGWRAGEYAERSAGVPYMEIAKRGGGINASVRSVRAMSESELTDRTRERLTAMQARGTTTVEIKSGYGLSTEAELKQLRAVRRVADEGWDVVPTFLGAHEVPPEYRDDREGYVTHLVNDMIPAVAGAGLARFCDVFCEPGVFTVAQSRRILEAGMQHGLVPKLHADELENGGGAELAADLGAASADHLAAISEAGIAALAHSRTVATLLPATMLFLGRQRYAPARRLLDAGATVALATDFNPGSSPTCNMPLVLTLACSQMGLDPLEAIAAATTGGAAAIRREDGTGSLAPGAPADLVVWDTASHQEIPYRFGDPPIRAVYKGGKQVFSCL